MEKDFKEANFLFNILLFICRIISVVIFGAFFYLIITPIGLVMRCCGKDPLGKKWDKTRESYWIRRG
jgi:ABC-type uncharacterized transport system permease subunit